ncbi:MAG: phosphonate C-P lyase system protein PhnG [Pseudomonadota bacterium]
MSKNGPLDRKARLSVLAQAPSADLKALWQVYTERNGQLAHEVLRPPEIGTVMVRGRAGAIGAAFNLGEITVTRCAVKTSTGAVGHGYVQGRDKAASLAAACIDALAQGASRAELDRTITIPLSQDMQRRQQRRASKAAGTKVEFFTMVRGDA